MKLGNFLLSNILSYRTMFHEISMFTEDPHLLIQMNFRVSFTNHPGVIFHCGQTEYLLSSKIF
jgi:hypothetical protein